MNIEALCVTPGSACPQPEPNATELPSCTPSPHIARNVKTEAAVAVLVALREGRARAPPGHPKAKSRATSYDTPFARSSAAFCAASFAGSSFTCRPRASVGGGTRVLGVGSAAER